LSSTSVVSFEAEAELPWLSLASAPPSQVRRPELRVEGEADVGGDLVADERSDRQAVTGPRDRATGEVVARDVDIQQLGAELHPVDEAPQHVVPRRRAELEH